MDTKQMDPETFAKKFREAFGDHAPLPIVFRYADEPCCPLRSVDRCIVGAISAVRDGEPLTLSSENVQCGGGGLYTAFRQMPERVPVFVSQTERYKKDEGMVRSYIRGMDIETTKKPFLNFMRADRLKTWEEAEGVIFFATPDILSGLCTWAFYDNNSEQAVSAPFSSGCGSILSFTVREIRNLGNRCFIGMLDPSARISVPPGELTFSVPMCRFRQMLRTMEDSALFRGAFSLIRKRMGGGTRKREENCERRR